MDHTSIASQLQAHIHVQSKIDSPESAGFFDAIKKIHEKTDAAASRKMPVAKKPPRESLNVGVIAMPPNFEHLRLARGMFVVGIK